MRSISEIIGPVMIGPSSSHTAGACRIGKVGLAIAQGEVKKAIFYLHGSFGKTYKGHGTDRALVAGLLGMNPDDDRLVNSIEIAKKNGMEIYFIEKDLGSMYHSNTVLMELQTKENMKVSIIGSSIGGGNIEIISINGENVYFTGKYNTLLINHIDKPGVVHSITGILGEEGINIAYLKVFRSNKGDNASMVFELDDEVRKDIIFKLQQIENVFSCISIKSVK